MCAGQHLLSYSSDLQDKRIFSVVTQGQGKRIQNLEKVEGCATIMTEQSPDRTQWQQTSI